MTSAAPRCHRLDGHSCPYDSSAHPPSPRNPLDEQAASAERRRRPDAACRACYGRGWLALHDPRDPSARIECPDCSVFDVRCHLCGGMMTSHVVVTRHASGTCDETLTGPELPRIPRPRLMDEGVSDPKAATALALGILECVDPVRSEIDKLKSGPSAIGADPPADPKVASDAVERERAAIVAWLRATPGEPGLPWVDMARDIADAIERGEDRGSG